MPESMPLNEMVDVVGFSYREAARALHIGEGTLTTRLFRARRRVADMLEPAAPEPGMCSTAPASLSV